MEADLVSVRRPIKLDRRCFSLFSHLKGEGLGLVATYSLRDDGETKKCGQKGLRQKIAPRGVRFKAGAFCEDGRDGVVAAVSDYPLKVRNAWGARLLSPAGGKAVLRMVPLERDKAIRRIDRSVTEMSAKRYSADKASEQASAETHLTR